MPTRAVLKGIEDAQSRGTKPDEMEVRPVDHFVRVCSVFPHGDD